MSARVSLDCRVTSLRAPSCIGLGEGFPCANRPERGKERCQDCRLTHDVARRLGRTVGRCSTCNDVIVLRPAKTTCLGCDERAVFGDRAEAILTPERDDVMSGLLARVDARQMTAAEARDALAAYDARQERRLFIGDSATGITYADREREQHGDYKKVAHLSFSDLRFHVADSASPLLREASEHAHQLQARRGQQYQVSGAGQTVTLGYALKEGAPK